MTSKTRAPSEDRTHDPWFTRPVLYPLSYGGNHSTNHTHTRYMCTAVVAEWLRRWTRNPLGSARTGSNPVGSDRFDNSSRVTRVTKGNIPGNIPHKTNSCRGRVVKAMDLKSIGLCPHRFEPCRQRSLLISLYKFAV